jgi:hypothetical protein
MSRCLRVAPVMPSSDLERTVDHYRRLGFSVFVESDEYAIARRDEVELHFSLVPQHDPMTNASSVFVMVDDVDALNAEWKASDVGQRTEPWDTEYQVRECAHLDPDNNLLRFASPLPGWRDRGSRS